jgi:hypothetical protein
MELVFDKDVDLLIPMLINDVVLTTEIMFVYRLVVVCRRTENSEDGKLVARFEVSLSSIFEYLALCNEIWLLNCFRESCI